MKWVNEKPTKVGWYWTRCDNDLLPVMTYVFDNNKAVSFFPNLAVDGTVVFNVNESKYEWFGPIPEPEE